MKIIVNLMLVVMAFLAISCGKDYSAERDKSRTEFEQYIMDAGIMDTLLPSGVYFIPRTYVPKGVKPKSGDNVIIAYSVYLLDSTFVRTNRSDAFKDPFVLNNSTALSQTVIPFSIRGLHEGLSHMHRGETATLIIPFEQAFEHREVSGYPRFTSFRIEVELINVEITIND